ncbi:MAG: NAD-dependent epimerase/dehydratase family protein, partial [Gammaproteobacteria bacterium]|nr:NAD-dependent epimerase/dehydratase family protein [Gammaproteobacteria bacterium]
MHIVITGAAGFLGQRLVQQLLARGELRGQPITQLMLLDQTKAPLPNVGNVAATSMALDITAPGALDSVLTQRPDVIYHLAAVVSSAAEADLELGMRVNFDATRALLEGCRAQALT